MPTTLESPTTIKEAIEIIASLVTTIAIILGGIWSYRLFWLRRQKYPQLDISHRIEHRFLDDHYNLIFVTINFKNTGNVVIRLNSGFVWVHQILPLLPYVEGVLKAEANLHAELRKLISDDGAYLWTSEVPWPIAFEQQLNSLGSFRTIEPGGTDQIRCDIILNHSIQTVKIYSFFKIGRRKQIALDANSKSRISLFQRRTKQEFGWSFASLYDIPQRVQNNPPKQSQHDALQRHRRQHKRQTTNKEVADK